MVSAGSVADDGPRTPLSVEPPRIAAGLRSHCMATTAATFPRAAEVSGFNHARAIFGLVVALVGTAIVLFLYLRGQPQTVEVLKAARDLPPGLSRLQGPSCQTTAPDRAGRSAGYRCWPTPTRHDRSPPRAPPASSKSTCCPRHMPPPRRTSRECRRRAAAGRARHRPLRAG